MFFPANFVSMNKRKLLKILKWTGISFFGLILLISILLYAFRQRIINYVVAEINTHLTAKVQVAKIDLTFWRTFPRVSVDFNQVLILDTMKNVNDTVLYSDLIRLKFDALKLWRHQYELEEAQIFSGVAKPTIYEDGRENYLFYKTDTTSASNPIDFSLHLVQAYKMRLKYTDQTIGQQYKAFINRMALDGDFKAEKYNLKVRSDFKIHSIRDQQVTLLSNKTAKINLKLLIDNKNDIIRLPQSTVEIERLPFLLDAYVDPKVIRVGVKGKNLQLQDVTNQLLANYAEIKKYKGRGKVTFDLALNSNRLKDEPPKVKCTFTVKNGQLIEPTQNITLSRINVVGEYSNEKGAGKEYIHLKQFDLVADTGPFSGQFLLTNFAAPRYKGIADGKVNLASLFHLVKVNEIEAVKGTMDTHLQFDVATVADKMHINVLKGTINLQQADLKLANDPRQFNNISGEVTFDQNEALVQNFYVKLGNSDLAFNGEFKNLEDFLFNQGKIQVNADLTSNYIDVADLKLDQSTTTETTSTVSLERVFQLPTNVEANLSIAIGNLKYKNHQFANIRSALLIQPHQLSFSQLNVENGGNSLQGSLNIIETQPEYFQVSTDLTADEIRFKPLFKEWNNFEQDVIREQNIDGEAKVHLQLSAPFDLRSGMDKKKINALVYVKITNGALNNVEMFKTIMQSLKKSATKLVISKRQLDLFEQRLMNLKFSVLENTFAIQNGRVTIPTMEIKSSALNVKLGGWHQFDDHIDYHFTFRLRDVKTYNRDSEFGYVEDDGTGVHVFMKMTGTMTNPQISWDKDTQKAEQHEKMEQHKEDFKSILKTGFGIGKKDSTIHNYQQTKKQEVIFDIDYGDQKETPPTPEKPSKLKQMIDKKAQEAKNEKEQQVEFDIE